MIRLRRGGGDPPSAGDGGDPPTELRCSLMSWRGRILEDAAILFSPPNDAPASAVRIAGAKSIASGVALGAFVMSLLAVTPRGWFFRPLVGLATPPYLVAATLISVGGFRLLVGAHPLALRPWLRVSIATAFGLATVALMAVAAIAIGLGLGL